MVDAYAGKVKEFDRDYHFIKDFISVPGVTLRGLKFIENDNVIVTESSHGIVAFFDSNGILLKEKKVNNPGILRQVTTDFSGNIYVTDLSNVQILKLDSNGDFIKSWKVTDLEETFGAYSVYYYDNSLLMSSLNNHRVVFTTLDGGWIKTWPGINAACIAMDKNSDFYFACYNRIVKTDKNGRVLAIMGIGFLKESQAVNICSNGDVLVTDETIPDRVFIYRQIR